MGRPRQPAEEALRRRAGALASAALAATLATVAPGLAPPARADAPAAARPTYRLLRFEEDWSVLRDPAALPSRDPFDPVKFVPLLANGEVWLSLGAQARGRIEGWSNFAFGGVPGDDTDDTLFESRLRAHADLHLGRWARGFVEVKSSLVTEMDLPARYGPARRDDFDVQNAFVDLTPPLPGTEARPITLRAGRQELLFGAQRLVGAGDWTNVRRTFDGVSLNVAFQPLRVTGFWTRPVRVKPTRANDHFDDDLAFYGVYATSALPGTGASLDVYWLGRSRDAARVAGSAGQESRHTFGARAFGAIGDSGLDYELEGAWQTGSLGDAAIHASMLAAEVGWWIVSLPTSPRFFVGADHASGDRRRGGGVQTFDPLFQTGHKWFGQTDLVGRSNVRAVSAGVTLRPVTATTLTLRYHRIWLADGHDALYAASGAVVRPGIGRSRSVGSELDLELGWRFDPHTNLGAGYGHFFADGFLRETGRARDVDFFTVWLQFTL